MAKAVLNKDEAEKLAVAYSPRKFPAHVSSTAVDFVAFQAAKTEQGVTNSFRIDKIVAQQTGIADLERVSIEERVEQEALSRLKELQEQAYQQAHQMGLEEGREKAFQEAKAEIDGRLQSLESVLASIEVLKSQLITFNETHVMNLVFHMVKKIVGQEIQANRELVLNVIQQAIESAQTEENITVRLSASDLAFVESTKEKLGKNFEGLKRARLEASDSINDGGCIIETNYGDVDATVEQRLGKLWDAVSGKLPKVKDTIGE